MPKADIKRLKQSALKLADSGASAMAHDVLDAIQEIELLRKCVETEHQFGHAAATQALKDFYNG